MVYYHQSLTVIVRKLQSNILCCILQLLEKTAMEYHKVVLKGSWKPEEDTVLQA